MAKVPAQAIASMTTKGTGNSPSNPEALKMARAAIAKAMPTKAHTIQDGKYEPKMLREGAPSQPLSKPNIGNARHNRDAGGMPHNALPWPAEPIALLIGSQCHRFILRQHPPLWGSACAERSSLARGVKKSANAVQE
jgi:hypothetical protein